MRRLLGKLTTGQAALFASALLLAAMFAIPYTRAGVLESISVKLGAWYYWIPGYTDAHNWVPEVTPPDLTGPDARLIKAYWDENGRSNGSYVRSNPTDLRLRALYLRRTLRNNSMSLVNIVDYPYAEFDPEEERKYAQKLAKLQANIPSVLAVAIEGERQEPANAFFPLAQAIAYESLRDRQSSRMALERAVAARYYNDYWHETRKVYEAATDRHIYDRMYHALFSQPDIGRELFQFVSRLSHSTGSEGLRMRGLLFDCLARIGSQSSTVEEFLSIKWAIRRFVPSDLLRKRGIDRSMNDGDYLRELNHLQDSLIAAGYMPKVDIPAFYATELSGPWFDDNSDPAAEFNERGYFALLKYEGAVIGGMFIIECLLGIVVIAPILLILSRVKPSRWQHFAVPPLIAFATSVAMVILDSRVLDSITFIGTCFLLAFVLSLYERTTRLSAVFGAAGALGGVLSGSLLYSESGGSEFLPPIVYAVAMARALWIRQRSEVRGWVVSTAGIVAIAIGAATIFPISLTERLTTYVPVAVFAVFGVSLWYRCHIGDATKRLLRSAPAAALAGVVLLLGASIWQHIIVDEMNWLIGVEAEMAERGREGASKIGPPVIPQ